MTQTQDVSHKWFKINDHTQYILHAFSFDL